MSFVEGYGPRVRYAAGGDGVAACSAAGGWRSRRNPAGRASFPPPLGVASPPRRHRLAPDLLEPIFSTFTIDDQVGACCAGDWTGGGGDEHPTGVALLTAAGGPPLLESPPPPVQHGHPPMGFFLLV